MDSRIAYDSYEKWKWSCLWAYLVNRSEDDTFASVLFLSQSLAESKGVRGTGIFIN